MDKAVQFAKPVFFSVQLLYHSFFSLSKQSSMKTGDEGDYLCFEITFLFNLHFLILSGQFAYILYPLFPALSYLPHVQSFHFFFFPSLITTSFSLFHACSPFLPSWGYTSLPTLGRPECTLEISFQTSSHKELNLIFREHFNFKCKILWHSVWFSQRAWKRKFVQRMRGSMW